MRILFITQKVDKDDDVLGVYHRWIEKLAEKAQKINVICLYRGRVELPENVRVFSLGKEGGHSRLKYLFNFYKFIWRLRKDYDKVFVHMNPEYVILAGWWWRLTNKKIIFWYAHYLANLKLQIAAIFANRIVTSTRLAYPLNSKKLTVLQQGIDIDKFKVLSPKKNMGHKILFLGRIAPVKDLETLLVAVNIVHHSVPDITLDIFGDPTDSKPAEVAYYEKIKKLVSHLGLQNRVNFRGRVANQKTPQIYNKFDLFINLTTTGSFDKSTLEAMACGLPVLVSNKAFFDIFDDKLSTELIFQEQNAADLAEKLKPIFAITPRQHIELCRKMRETIKQKHDLPSLITRIVKLLSQ